MGKEAQQEWSELFTKDLEHLWDTEPIELRMIVIVHRVLQKEFKRVDDSIKERIKTQKHRLKVATSFEESTFKDNSLSPTRISPESITLLEQSPKIKRHRRAAHVKSACSPSLLNISKDLDTSSFSLLKPVVNVPSDVPTQSSEDVPDVIICEPDEIIDCSILNDSTGISRTSKKCKPSKSKKSLLVNKSKRNVFTLTQLIETKSFLNNASKSTKADEGASENSGNKGNVLSKSTQKPKLFGDYDRIPVKKSNIPEHPHKTEPVRCKAEKLKLPGWSCKECKEYYEDFDLPEEELREKMNVCSKHRNKFNPFNETPKGFWDVTIYSSPDN